MFRSGKCALGLAIILLSCSSYADNYNLAPGVMINFNFPPYEPQVFNNYFPFPITGKCTVRTADDNDLFNGKMLNGTAKIDNVRISKGESMVIVVSNKMQINIVVEPNAEAELINTGASTVTAICSAT